MRTLIVFRQSWSAAALLAVAFLSASAFAQTTISSVESNKAVVATYMGAYGTDGFDAVAANLEADGHRLTRHEFENLRYNADDPELSKLSDPPHVAIADRVNTVTRILGQADRVAVTYRFTGRHVGDLFGIPATGKVIELEGAAMFTLADGRITESWFLAEEAGLLRQLDARLPERADGKLNLPPTTGTVGTYDDALARHLAQPQDTPEWRHTRLLLAYKALPENRPADYTFTGRPYLNIERGGIDVIKFRGEELGIAGGHGESMSGRRDMIADTVADGDLAMMRFRLTALNDGPLYGIPPGGKRLNDWEVGFARFEGDDWIDAWWLKDELGFLLSIGNQEALEFLVDNQP